MTGQDEEFSPRRTKALFTPILADGLTNAIDPHTGCFKERVLHGETIAWLIIVAVSMRLMSLYTPEPPATVNASAHEQHRDFLPAVPFPGIVVPNLGKFRLDGARLGMSARDLPRTLLARTGELGEVIEIMGTNLEYQGHRFTCPIDFASIKRGLGGGRETVRYGCEETWTGLEWQVGNERIFAYRSEKIRTVFLFRISLEE